LALILTIDRTLNNIWRVRTPRPLAQRVFIYWAAITLGPVMLAASLSTTSYVVSATSDVVGRGMGSCSSTTFEFALLAVGMASLYHYVPNTNVRWSHAWAGGIFVAAAIEIAKRVLGYYLSLVPTYSVVYGAFATLPILLVWIYVAWVIVLLGAVVAAYLPSLLTGVARRGGPRMAGRCSWRWSRCSTWPVRGPRRQGHGRGRAGAGACGVDALQLERRCWRRWCARLDRPLAEEPDDEDPRYVLLADPSTPIEPLLMQLMMPRAEPLEDLWQKGPLRSLRLGDVLLI
jgi:membrane protein